MLNVNIKYCQPLNLSQVPSQNISLPENPPPSTMVVRGGQHPNRCLELIASEYLLKTLPRTIKKCQKC